MNNSDKYNLTSKEGVKAYLNEHFVEKDKHLELFKKWEKDFKKLQSIIDDQEDIIYNQKNELYEVKTELESLKIKFNALKNEFFFHENDLFTRFCFNLNVLSIVELYHLFKEFKLLNDSINIGKFFHLLYPENSDLIHIDLKKALLTIPDFGFLLHHLIPFYKNGEKDEFIKFLNKKFKITTSQNRLMDFINIKDDYNIIRLYKNDDIDINKKQKVVLNYTQRIKKIQNKNKQ